MNNDHVRMTAKLSANSRGRSHGRVSGGFLTQGSARRAVAACLLAWCAVGAVQAQDRGGFRRDDVQQQQQQQPQHRDDRGDRNAQRQDAPRYEPRPDDSHRQDRNADAQRRSGRLTADERRDLRRQINEAGVDLYPNTPRR